MPSDSDPTVRVTLRLPASLKEDLEALARDEGRTLNAQLVRLLALAAREYADQYDPRGGA